MKEKDDKILLAQVSDKIEMCENKNKIEYTDFLDLAQIELVQNYIDKLKIENYMSYGGFDQAERKMFVIYPEKFNSAVVEKNLSNIVKIVRIQLPEDLKGYDKYEVVYILDDEIKETIPAVVEDGYITFVTTHLSQYGIVATNVETTDQETTASISQTTGNKTDTAITTGNKTAGSPKTGDDNHMMLWIAVLALSCTGVISYTMHSRRKKLDQ